MDNACLSIGNKEVEVCLDRGGHIEGFAIDDKPIAMHIDTPESKFILFHMVELQEEAASVIDAWVRTHVMHPAYWGEG